MNHRLKSSRLVSGGIALCSLLAFTALGPPAVGQTSEPAKDSSATLQVAIAGQVRNPGPVELKPGATALDAIAKAGGFTDAAVASGVKVTRISETSAAEITVDCTKSSGDNKAETKTGNFPLLAGDMIFVP
jgi:protein involved in polysaccharide export with SLBB domain